MLHYAVCAVPHRLVCVMHFVCCVVPLCAHLAPHDVLFYAVHCSALCAVLHCTVCDVLHNIVLCTSDKGAEKEGDTGGEKGVARSKDAPRQTPLPTREG